MEMRCFWTMGHAALVTTSLTPFARAGHGPCTGAPRFSIIESAQRLEQGSNPERLLIGKIMLDLRFFNLAD
jgi:hypothetical protein